MGSFFVQKCELYTITNHITNIISKNELFDILKQERVLNLV